MIWLQGVDIKVKKPYMHDGDEEVEQLETKRVCCVFRYGLDQHLPLFEELWLHYHPRFRRFLFPFVKFNELCGERKERIFTR